MKRRLNDLQEIFDGRKIEEELKQSVFKVHRGNHVELISAHSHVLIAGEGTSWIARKDDMQTVLPKLGWVLMVGGEWRSPAMADCGFAELAVAYEGVGYWLEDVSFLPVFELIRYRIWTMTEPIRDLRRAWATAKRMHRLWPGPTAEYVFLNAYTDAYNEYRLAERVERALCDCADELIKEVREKSTVDALPDSLEKTFALRGKVSNIGLPEMRALADACCEDLDMGERDENMNLSNFIHATYLSQTSFAALSEAAEKLLDSTYRLQPPEKGSEWNEKRVQLSKISLRILRGEPMLADIKVALVDLHDAIVYGGSIDRREGESYA